MAGTRVRLALLLGAMFILAGCLSAPTPDWGKGTGEIHVEFVGKDAKIHSGIGTVAYDETINLIDYSVDSESICDRNKISVTGQLLTSIIYESHTDDAVDHEQAIGASVIIHKMSFNEAKNVEEGKGGRVDLKPWISPLTPQEKVGNKISEFEADWAVIGIIPGSENIADNLNILEDWHQAITIDGYVLNVTRGSIEVDDSCVVLGQGHAMVITKITTETGVVTMEGDDDDEWSMGDTDIFGGWTFLFFFMIAAGGGGFGLYIVSTMLMRQGATSTAKTLLGREGFEKAVQMKKDLKKDRAENISSSSETRAKPKATPKREVINEEPSERLAGFSLDSVLSSGHSIGGPGEFSGGGVTITESAAGMVDSQIEPVEPVVSHSPVNSVSSVNPVSSAPSGPSRGQTYSQPESVSDKKGHFSSAMRSSSIATQPSRAASPTEAAKPVKRRSVKKRAVTEEQQPPQKTPEPVRRSSVADDDFDDFSL
jgi:hypothetical protein